jgi:voltage-dependent anion channel protein 2
MVSYEDFGKNTKDLLSKPYFAGLQKLSVSTRTPDDLKFTVEGEQKDNKVKATLKAEFKSDPDGFSLTEKWDTDNKVQIEVGLKDHLAPGLKFTVKGDFTESKEAPAIGGEVIGEYSHEVAAVKVSVNPFSRTIGFNGTAGTAGFVAGVDTSFDVNNTKLNDVNAKCGYIGAGWSGVASALKNFQEFGFQYFHQVNASVTVGGAFELKKDASDPLFTVAADYKPDATTKISSKADSTGKVDVAYSVALKPGVTIGVATQVDSGKITSGAKTGFSFNFEA